MRTLTLTAPRPSMPSCEHSCVPGRRSDEVVLTFSMASRKYLHTISVVVCTFAASFECFVSTTLSSLAWSQSAMLSSFFSSAAPHTVMHTSVRRVRDDDDGVRHQAQKAIISSPRPRGCEATVESTKVERPTRRTARHSQYNSIDAPGHTTPRHTTPRLRVQKRRTSRRAIASLSFVGINIQFGALAEQGQVVTAGGRDDMVGARGTGGRKGEMLSSAMACPTLRASWSIGRVSQAASR